jgi:hypothetical protein
LSHKSYRIYNERQKETTPDEEERHTATKCTKKPKVLNKDGMNTVGNIWEHHLPNEEYQVLDKAFEEYLLQDNQYNKEGLFSEN